MPTKNNTGRPSTLPQPWRTLADINGGVGELAERMGVDRVAIYRWAHGEQGMNGPARKLFELLLKEAGITPKEDTMTYEVVVKKNIQKGSRSIFHVYHDRDLFIKEVERHLASAFSDGIWSDGDSAMALQFEDGRHIYYSKGDPKNADIDIKTLVCGKFSERTGAYSGQQYDKIFGCEIIQDPTGYFEAILPWDAEKIMGKFD